MPREGFLLTTHLRGPKNWLARTRAFFFRAGDGIASPTSSLSTSGKRGTFDELCVNDVCVTRDQFAEVFGNQSAAAGTPVTGASEAPGGSSASVATNADTATSTTAANDSEPAVAEDAQNASEPEEAPDNTLLVDTPAAPEPAPELEPANDNTPRELPATGTE